MFKKKDINKLPKFKKKYDLIVIGAGHAGCEAALAASRMGCLVLLLTIDIDKIATLPCSPSIGGMGKGQLVKEIDALGGEMAKIADKSATQYKTLNTRKGSAVHSTRTQNDKVLYHLSMKKVIEKQINLDLKQGSVEKIIIKNKKIVGIIDNTGLLYNGKTIILSTGTFLNGKIHMGYKSIKGGRAGEYGSYKLAKNLKKIGYQLETMKTGTPPRIDKFSIDFSKFKKIPFDIKPQPFSYSSKKTNFNQMPSYIGYTNFHTQEIVKKNLKLSSLYSGLIKGTPARYCPSFEDKIVKFSNKIRHHVILEFEGSESQEIYLSGLGNSLPIQIQIEMIRSIIGLENTEIIRPGYAIEYDYINPIHLKPTLESKLISNLYMAGQVNGTSGYEEAAAQGIYSGINAACKVKKKKEFILNRSNSYIGVMIDDLVTKGTKEPYRMFTSRAEYRLLLREDNADFRLSNFAYDFNLVSKKIINTIEDDKKEINKEINRINKIIVKPSDKVNLYLEKKNSPLIKNGINLSKLIKRTEINYEIIDTFFPSNNKLKNKVKKQVEIEIKYSGYIKKQKSEIEKFKNLEKINIPDIINYQSMNGLSNELKEKLLKIKPISLGQASRIDGMTPAALSVILIYIKLHHRNNSKLVIKKNDTYNNNLIT